MRYFISVRGVISGQILLALILIRKIKKKYHQNLTIINEMAVISVSTKVPLLWTIIPSRQAPVIPLLV